MKLRFGASIQFLATLETTQPEKIEGIDCFNRIESDSGD